MIESALHLVQQSIASPWVYLVLLLLAMLDAFIPMIPGETALVIVAVFMSAHESGLVLICVAGALGAFFGDHIAYFIGRVAIDPLSARLPADSRRWAAYEWARTSLSKRGAYVLLGSRYVPGVRTAVTITMGGVAYPLRYFSLVDVAAASFWATGWAVIGHLGGVTFGTDPLKGLLFGLGLAAALMVLIAGAQRLWLRLPSR